MRETPKAAAAYAAYAALGPSRSLRKLAEQDGKPSGNLRQLEEWSAVHGWQVRVKQDDAELAEERRLKREDALDRMNEEQALIGRTQALRAVKQIEALIAAQKFGSQAAVALLKTATDLERIARGAATARLSMADHNDAPLQGVAVVYLPQKEAKGGLDERDHLAQS